MYVCMYIYIYMAEEKNNTQQKKKRSKGEWNEETGDASGASGLRPNDRIGSGCVGVLSSWTLIIQKLSDMI